MTMLHDRARVASFGGDPAEALIEEARQRHRRRQTVVAAIAALVAAGTSTYVAVAGGGGTTRHSGATRGFQDPARLSGSAAANSGPNGLLASCALESLQAGTRQTIPPTVDFVRVRSGEFGSLPWSLWYGAAGSAQPYLFMTSGSGQNVLCVEPGEGLGISIGSPRHSSHGWYGFAQLPGKPVAFVFGDVPPASKLSRLTAVVNGHSASLVPERFGSLRYSVLFAEVAGLRCATSPNALTGIYESSTVYSGNRVISSGGDVATLNSASTPVRCGLAVAPLASLTSDLATAPPALRAAVVQTMDAPSVALDVAVEHPLSAKTWVTEPSTYGAPDLYQGQNGPARCAAVGGFSGDVATVDIGSSQYRVHESCVNGRVIRSGSSRPRVERTAVSSVDGLTPAQVAAFGGLLTTIRTATSFHSVEGGYTFVSDMNRVIGNYVTGGPPTTGTISVSDGYVTSVSASSYWPDCEPLGPSCRFGSSTTYSESNARSGIKVPTIRDYSGGHA